MQCWQLGGSRGLSLTVSTCADCSALRSSGSRRRHIADSCLPSLVSGYSSHSAPHCTPSARAAATIGVMRSRSPSGKRPGARPKFRAQRWGALRKRRGHARRRERPAPAAASRRRAGLRARRASRPARRRPASQGPRAFRLEAGAAERDDRTRARRHVLVRQECEPATNAVAAIRVTRSRVPARASSSAARESASIGRCRGDGRRTRASVPTCRSRLPPAG